MGKSVEHPKVTLIIGFIFKDDGVLSDALQILEKKFGKTSLESPVFKFSYTNYYDGEMGAGLLRKFVSYRRPVRPQSLSRIKLATNKIELRLSCAGRRNINIDPGYITPGKLVLATTKDQQHRIYLGQGIYAEVTLRFTDGSFSPWEWTYPDYKTKEYADFFNTARKSYMQAGKSN